MAKWILRLFLFFGIMSCQSETKKGSSKISLPPESGTIAPPSRAAVPLIFFLKETEILNGGDQLSLKDSDLFHSLPLGVYPIESDTILFGKTPRKWINSGIMRWPVKGKVALEELIMTDIPLFSNEIAIFPQKPSKNGYFPGCFGCPDWMAGSHAVLSIFWEKHANQIAF